MKNKGLCDTMLNPLPPLIVTYYLNGQLFHFFVKLINPNFDILKTFLGVK
jgi:hypothetical protein